MTQPRCRAIAETMNGESKKPLTACRFGPPVTAGMAPDGGPGDGGRNRGTFPVSGTTSQMRAPGSGVIPSRKTRVVKPIRRGDALRGPGGHRRVHDLCAGRELREHLAVGGALLPGLRFPLLSTLVGCETPSRRRRAAKPEAADVASVLIDLRPAVGFILMDPSECIDTDPCILQLRHREGPTMGMR